MHGYVYVILSGLSQPLEAVFMISIVEYSYINYYLCYNVCCIQGFAFV